MAAITKGSGRYFSENERVWDEARLSGYEPFFVGDWNGKAALPERPTKELVRDLAQGSKFLDRVQKNRVGGFDATYTCSKSASIVLYGLTPFGQWKEKSTALLVEASRPEVEAFVANQRVNIGARGEKKAKSRGGAVAFPHWESSFNVPHAHVHYFIANLSCSPSGKLKSVANAGELYAAQGVMNARFQKRLDDKLQDRGFRTRREGRAVGIDGIPDKMVEALSPSRRAMREAMRKKGFTTPRAQDFYARHARRGAGRRTLGDPERLNERCQKLAAKHGVTVRSLKLPPGERGKHRDRYTAASVAHDAVREARDLLTKKHGAFTREQFLECALTRSIGRATTFDAVDAAAGAALENPKILGIEKQKLPDGSVRYAGPDGAWVQREAGLAFKPDTLEAWGELKRAAKGLGEAAFVATTHGAARVLERLSEAVNPPPRLLVLDAENLPAFVAMHRPTPYLVAHAKALAKGLLAPGNPHEKALAAEKVYASLRHHNRLPKNAVLVVERGQLASARDLHLLSKIARRDKASVVLADRGRPTASQGRARHVQNTTAERERDLGR